MGLPTSIPSGGDGLDNFSKPSRASQQKAPARSARASAPKSSREPQATTEELSEFEEFQRWKRMKESQASSPTKAASSEPRRTRSVHHEDIEPLEDSGATYSKVADDKNASLERRIDPKTGLEYTAIPKTVMGSDGFPLLAIDIDIDNLNGEAQTFLAHLRVPPSKEEQEEILRKRAERAQEQNAERAEIDAQLEEELGSLDDPFEEPTKKKRSLFSKKR